MYVDTNEQPLTSPHTKKRSMVVDDEYNITFTLQAGLEDGAVLVLMHLLIQNRHYLASSLACMLLHPFGDL